MVYGIPLKQTIGSGITTCCWCHRIIEGGRYYLRDKGHVIFFCYDCIPVDILLGFVRNIK